MSYKSKYRGEEIDDGISKAMSAVQPNELSDVAKSGSYNDLEDKPTIPTLQGYATEQFVANAIEQAITTTLNTEV